ncbi:MAG: phage tail fiber protein, partial [Pseudomonadota bacterium]|nr:phage tail fiber protein [Pseudomonadota bacterium]
MTNHVKIQGVAPRIQYTADGTSTDYEFPFAIFTSDDLDVYWDDILQSTDSYTVRGIRHSDGGTVSFNEPPQIDTIITIVRNLSIER